MFDSLKARLSASSRTISVNATASTHVASPPGDITHEVYDISPRPVGFGGFSDVYTGIWRSVRGEQKVAIKVIRSRPFGTDLQRILMREISVWRRLQHRNLNVLCGFYEGFGSLPALVSPWHSNGDINNYLRWRTADPAVDRIKTDLVLGAMNGLRYLHDHSLVHGDVKGSNILVSEDGVARLCDYGLTRIFSEHSESVAHSGTIGTFRWMAPELLLVDGARHSYASDMWAVGCLFIEVWGGVVPYHTRSKQQQVLIALSMGEAPDRPSSMGDFIWQLVRDCCRPDPMRRPTPCAVIACLNALHLVTLDGPLDTHGEILLCEIEASIHAPNMQAAFHMAEDSDSPATVVWTLATSCLSRPHALPFRAPIFHWCLVQLQPRISGEGKAASLDDTEDKVLYRPSELRPLARLLESARPGMAQAFMSQFASAEADDAVKKLLSATCAAWFPDGDRIALGCEDGIVCIDDVATGTTLRSIVAHTYPIRNVAISPNGRTVAPCIDDRTITLWDAETGTTSGTIELEVGNVVHALAFSPDGRCIATGSRDHTLRVWSTEDCCNILGWIGHDDAVTSLAYSPDGSRIVSGSKDGSLRLWDAASGVCLAGPLEGHTGCINSIAFAPDGSQFATGSRDSQVCLWTAATGRSEGSALRHVGAALCVAYSPLGTVLAASFEDGTIYLMEMALPLPQPYAPPRILRGHTAAVHSVSFSPDGTRLVSASSDCTVRIWDATDQWLQWDISPINGPPRISQWVAK